MNGGEGDNVFTLMCTINTFKAVEAYLMFLETLFRGTTIERYWQQVEKVLSVMSRWLTVRCQDYTIN